MELINYQHLIDCGVTQWNQWRIEHPHHQPDLRGLNLSRSYLFEVNLMGSNLSGVDLRRACLIGANLSQSNLSGANLRGAYLSDANLREANLSNADLTDAQLINADLLRANLIGTCLATVLEDVSSLSPSATEALPFSRHSLNNSINIPLNVSASQKNTPTEACITKCIQQLSDYYIVPIAKMLVDDAIAARQPTSDRQLVEYIAEQLSPDEAKRFSYQVLAGSGQ